MAKYSTSFTVGALFFEESEVLIPLILAGAESEIEEEIDSGVNLKINTKLSRKKKAHEITARFEAVDKAIWELYVDLNSNEAKLILLYYAALKTYNLVLAFHLEVVLDKWDTGNFNLDKNDYYNFLMKKKGAHPEIEEWSDSTQSKIASTNILMLKEVGLLDNGRLEKIRIPFELASFFGERGEWWFLEALFMTREEMREIAKQIRK